MDNALSIRDLVSHILCHYRLPLLSEINETLIFGGSFQYFGLVIVNDL